MYDVSFDPVHDVKIIDLDKAPTFDDILDPVFDEELKKSLEKQIDKIVKPFIGKTRNTTKLNVYCLEDDSINHPL